MRKINECRTLDPPPSSLPSISNSTPTTIYNNQRNRSPARRSNLDQLTSNNVLRSLGEAEWQLILDSHDEYMRRGSLQNSHDTATCVLLFTHSLLPYEWKHLPSRLLLISHPFSVQLSWRSPIHFVARKEGQARPKKAKAAAHSHVLLLTFFLTDLALCLLSFFLVMRLNNMSKVVGDRCPKKKNKNG